MSGLISYIRVSGTQQGKNGLDLAAQRGAMEIGEADALHRRAQLAAAVVAARRQSE
jgi:hypothetical protein